jgi:16S rRNA (guanine527-N7)-methyltransferase
VAKALAPPPTAVEWCLPLVREGGAAVLWVGPSAEPARAAAVAEKLAGRLEDAPSGFLVIRKIGPTPPGFPRRPGMAKKRPLA